MKKLLFLMILTISVFSQETRWGGTETFPFWGLQHEDIAGYWVLDSTFHADYKATYFPNAPAGDSIGYDLIGDAHLTINGGAGWRDSLKAGSIVYNGGNVLRLSSTADDELYSTSNIFNPDTGDYCWIFRVNYALNGQYILDKGTTIDANSYYRLYYPGATGRINMRWYGYVGETGGQTLQEIQGVIANPPIEEFFTFVGQIEQGGDSVEIWIDNVHENRGDFNNAVDSVSNSEAFTIGAQTNFASEFTGKFMDLAVARRFFSPLELENIIDTAWDWYVSSENVDAYKDTAGADWKQAFSGSDDISEYIGRVVNAGGNYSVALRAYAETGTPTLRMGNPSDSASFTLSTSDAGFGEQITFSATDTLRFWGTTATDSLYIDDILVEKQAADLLTRNQYNVKFDTDEYLKVSTANYRSADASGSISVWFKLSSVPAGNIALFTSADEATALSYLVFSVRGGVLEVSQLNSDTEDRITGSTTCVANTLYHAVLESSGTAWSIYLNGAAEGLTVAAGSNTGDWFSDTSARDNVVIGAFNYSSVANFFEGEIDEVAVFTSTGNAATVYNDGTPNDISEIAGLVDYWRFEEGIGQFANPTIGSLVLKMGAGAGVATDDGEWTASPFSWDNGGTVSGFGGWDSWGGWQGW